MIGDQIPVDIMARREDWSYGVSISMRYRGQGGECMLAQPVTFEKLDEGLIAPPFVTLVMNDAQKLMDELWGCGLRPSEGTGSAGSLKATENHLADMKKIAFRTLDIMTATAGLMPTEEKLEGKIDATRE